MKRLALFLSAVLAAAPAPAQYNATILPGSSIGAMTSQRLRLVPINPSSPAAGMAEAVGTANLAKLNAWTSTGWKTERLSRIDFEGRGFGISGTWDLGNVESIRVNGGGMPDYRAESEYVTLGGPASRLIWLPRGSQAGPMIRVRGRGFVNDGLTLQGNVAASDSAAMKLDTAHRVDVAIEVQGQQGGSGVGSFSAPNLAIMGAQTGIKTVPVPVELNADHGQIRHYFTAYCNRGLWSTNLDSLGWEVSYCQCYNTNIAFEYQRGGDFYCGTLHPFGPLTHYGLVISGHDQAAGGDFVQGTFDIGRTKLDATLPSDFRVLTIIGPVVASVQKYAGVDVRIGNLRGSSTRTSGALIVLENTYADVLIDKGWLLYPRFIKVDGGTAALHPTVRVRDVNFNQGSAMNDIRNLFTDDSDDYVSVIFEGGKEMTGFTGHNNNGKFYAPFEALIDITGTNSYVIH